MESAIKSIFCDAQRPYANEGALVKQLVTLSVRHKTDIATFRDTFTALVNHALVVGKREPSVERLVRILSAYAASTSSPDSENANTDFVPFFVDSLLARANAQDKAVRFRVCQIVAKILQSLPEEAEVDDACWENVHDAMMIRTKDRMPLVRVQAINALSRLQDPTNPDCPVILEFIRLMTTDSSPDVRKAALGNMALSKLTARHIIGRTRDIKDAVRRHAFNVLTQKVHVRAFSISDRITLLEHGLSDRDESVRKACVDMLVGQPTSWLESLDGSIVALLECLDVQHEREHAVTALRAVLGHASQRDRVYTLADFDMASLTPERVLFWSVVADTYKEEEEALEALLPDVPAFAEVLETHTTRAAHAHREMITISASAEDASTDDENLENAIFVAGELLNMALQFDFADEGGRQNMMALVTRALTDLDVPPTHLEALVQLSGKLCSSLSERCELVAQLISDVREPIQLQATPKKASSARSQTREMQMRLAAVKISLMELDDKKEALVAAEDFAGAAEVKERIEELKQEKEQLMAAASDADQQVTEAKKEATRQVKNSPSAWRRCLALCTHLLEDIAEPFSTSQRPPESLVELVESLLLPAIQLADPVIRNAAVRALGLYCLHDLALARVHLLLFLQVAQVDQDELIVTSLQVLFDLMLTYGPDAFSIAKPQEGSEEEREEDDDDDSIEPKTKKSVTTFSVLPVLMRYLDHENGDLRTVAAEGFARLLFCSRIVSSQLLSRLLILYFNPTTEEDTRLRQALSVFFPAFAFASLDRQQLLADAFIPTLKTIANAPKTSPLHSIKLDTVSRFIVYLCDGVHLSEMARRRTARHATPVHDDIAEKVCNEVIALCGGLDESVLCSALCRVLVLLRVSVEAEELMEGLRVLVTHVIDTLDDRAALKNVLKFQALIEPEEEEDEVREDVDEDVEEEEDEEEEEKETPVKVAQKRTTTSKARPKRATSNKKTEEVEAPAGEEDEEHEEDIENVKVTTARGKAIKSKKPAEPKKKKKAVVEKPVVEGTRRSARTRALKA